MESTGNNGNGEPPADLPIDEEQPLQAASLQVATSVLEIPDSPTGGAVWDQNMIDLKRNAMSDDISEGAGGNYAQQPVAAHFQPPTVREPGATTTNTTNRASANNGKDDEQDDILTVPLPRNSRNRKNKKGADESPATAAPEIVRVSQATGRGLRRKSKNAKGGDVTEDNPDDSPPGDEEVGAFHQDTPAPFRSAQANTSFDTADTVIDEESPATDSPEYVAVATLVREPTLHTIVPAVEVPEQVPETLAKAEEEDRNDEESKGSLSDLLKNRYLLRLVALLCCFFLLVVVVVVVALRSGSDSSEGTVDFGMGTTTATISVAETEAPVPAPATGDSIDTLGPTSSAPSTEQIFGGNPESQSTPIGTPADTAPIDDAFCGSTFAGADNCETACPGGDDSGCPSGEFCFPGVICSTIRTPTGTPTVTPTVTPTATPVSSLSSNPTDDFVSSTPAGAPSSTPSGTPTQIPSGSPTARSSNNPTHESTSTPTAPSSQPTQAQTPTASPVSSGDAGTFVSFSTGSPTAQTALPTGSTSPSSNSPETLPSSAPTGVPSFIPTAAPSRVTSSPLTDTPSGNTTASSSPTMMPTSQPTVAPTSAPVAFTDSPSLALTATPSETPTTNSAEESSVPTTEPTLWPAEAPTPVPSVAVGNVTEEGSLAPTITGNNPANATMSGPPVNTTLTDPPVNATLTDATPEPTEVSTPAPSNNDVSIGAALLILVGNTACVALVSELSEY